MAETGASDSSSPETDRDFDPTAEMLIHDYDDERTLEEEEGYSGDSCCNELDDLQKEGDMPLDELLAMYGYANQDGIQGTVPQDTSTRSSSEEEILSNQDLTLDKDEIARDLLQNSDDNDQETSVTDLLDSVSSSQTARLLRSSSRPGSEYDDSEEDMDYVPIAQADEDWKKTIQVGSDFQAPIPPGLSKYGDAPAYENEDRLLWDPNKLDDETVNSYLQKVHAQNMQNAMGVNAIPQGCHIRDDEQALYLLLQCGQNVEEALRRRKMQAVPPSDPMSLWSEEECRNFENGLRHYGKEFYLIQQNKVRTRSVGELVQFYYLWKKTERHDMFANKNRLEKRKYALHPGVTDYMDRFLDEQEHPPPNRDRSSSPNIHSLIYGDQKRHLRMTSESDDQSVFQPIHSEGSASDTYRSTASPKKVKPQTDVKSCASLMDSKNSNSYSHANGVVESSEPLCKKLKTEVDSSPSSNSRHHVTLSDSTDSYDNLVQPVGRVCSATDTFSSGSGSSTFSSISHSTAEPVAQ